MDAFYKRFLFKTTNMLGKLDNLPNITLNEEETINLSIFSLKEYHLLYKKYYCEHVKDHSLVFCSCYNLYQIYVRNKALLLFREVSKIESTIKPDEFLLFLEGVVTKENKCFKKAIEKNDLFWEAYEFLEEIPHVKTSLGQKLLSLHKLRAGISLEDNSFTNLFPQYLGTYFYHKKDFDRSLIYYEKYFAEINELDFIDLYSNILYLKNDKRLAMLAYKSYKVNKFRAETNVVVANYYSMKKDHFDSIKYFKNAIKLSSKFSICYTLIGHEFMELKNYQEAIKNYTLSVKLNKDYRAWFGLGQAYSALRIFQFALVFFKMSVNIRPNDAFLWLTFGNCYAKLKKDDCSKCFLKAYTLGEKESLVYLADYYKNQKKYSDSVKYYEKYVNEGGKESKRIIEFLLEYFNRLGNKKKVLLYKERLQNC